MGDFIGKNCFIWAGPKPILQIMDPTMIHEMLAKYEDFEKIKGANPLISLLAKGLAHLEGDQWEKHRKIINPAFHVEKLKVFFCYPLVEMRQIYGL